MRAPKTPFINYRWGGGGGGGGGGGEETRGLQNNCQCIEEKNIIAYKSFPIGFV
jgi:hypothetical protein